MEKTVAPIVRFKLELPNGDILNIAPGEMSIAQVPNTETPTLALVIRNMPLVTFRGTFTPVTTEQPVTPEAE